jgi:predicted TIM-barrel fold metal-dependent hydrolase
MIVDCNVSLGQWPFRRLRDADPAGFVRWMDDCGVTQAWVAPFEALLFGPVQEANEMLAEALEGYGDRLLQVPVVNPAYQGWEDDLAAALEIPGPALRLLPSYHSYALDDPAMAELLAAVADAGRVVQIVVRVQDERHHHPRVMVPPVSLKPLRDLAAAYPKLQFVVLNAGVGEIRGVTGDAPPANCHFDISHVEGVGGVGELVAAIGAEHVLFGSHAALQVIEASVLKITEADLSDEQRAAVLYGNAQRLMAGF